VSQLVVLEQSGKWAAAWRSSLRGNGIAIREARLPATASQHLDDDPASIVAIEANAEKLPALLDWLAMLNRRWPAARAIACVDRDGDSLHRPLREAGAIAVVDSPRAVSRATNLVARHVELAPQRHKRLTARILAALPFAEQG